MNIVSHELKSYTRNLNIFYLEKYDMFLCDTPGFLDTDGDHVSILNAFIISLLSQKCQTICPILLINPDSLAANVRSKDFKDIL